MRLLVTGGLGFIGSNFIIHVLENYDSFEIVNIDDELIGSNRKNLMMINNNKNYKFVKGNITDTSIMEKLIADCDIIINFAAESHVDRSISNPRSFMKSNIMGVFTILEILKKYPKKFVQISTDEVFGTIKEGNADENFRLNPSSPYSSSKASAELLIQSYVTTYGLNAVITRCSNNYGPRQFPEKLIPKTIILADQNNKIPIYGTGTSRREWIFVDDHCEAIMKIINEGKKALSYNISAYNEFDNLTVVKKILSIMDKSEDLLNFVEGRPGEDYRYSLDSSRIRSELNWKHKVNFDEGLKRTIDWYFQNRRWWNHIKIDDLNLIPWKN